MAGCSSSKDAVAPTSLYKTKEGKARAFASYDSAMTLWNVPYEESFVETSYGKSHVLVSGKQDGHPVILLPGLFGDATMWYPNVGDLSKNYRVYSIDMLNYGGKGQPAGRVIRDIHDYKRWLIQIMDHYQLEKAALAGVSYGSWLALALAREMPDSVSALMLMDPSETFMPMNGGIAWKGFKAFMFFPNRQKYDEFFTWIGGGYRNADMEIWFEHMLDVIEFGSTGMMDVPQHRTYEREELAMVTMPVLVMAGGKPILYEDPEEFRQNAQRALPHAEVLIVPGAGHGLNMEKPAFVNDRMAAFLDDHL